ncbi:MAG: hypothetical protein V1716_05795 [Candidatus Uhrbacteria bacterium]
MAPEPAINNSRFRQILSEEPDGHKRARIFKPDNFIGLAETTKLFGELTAEQRTALEQIPYTTEDLCASSPSSFLIPDLGTSIEEITMRLWEHTDRHFLPPFRSNNVSVSDDLKGAVNTPRWRLLEVVKQHQVRPGDKVADTRTVVYASALCFATSLQLLFDKVVTDDSHIETAVAICEGRRRRNFLVYEGDSQTLVGELEFEKARHRATLTTDKRKNTLALWRTSVGTPDFPGFMVVIEKRPN